MSKTFQAFTLCICAILSACNSLPKPTSMKNADDLLNELVQKGKTPSVQYLLFDQNQILHQYRAGLADVAGQFQADEKTSYNAFSVTKTFTALAILQLVEEGKVDLDKNASDYIDKFPYTGNITVRHLLSHTGGIPNPNPLPWIHRAEEHEVFDRNAFFDQVFEKHSKVKSLPNEKFAYSNLGYVLLGQLIEQVTGMTYETYTEENILKPLGISSEEMGFELTDPGFHAKGYHKKNSLMNLIIGIFINKKEFRGPAEGPWKPFKPYYINGASYGGLSGNPEAFMKYAQEFLKPDSKLISAEYKQILFTENYTLDKKPSGMCLSWFTNEFNGQRYLAHAGGGGGYYCEVRVYPEAGVGSVIMFNRSGMSDEKFLSKLDKFFFQAKEQ